MATLEQHALFNHFAGLGGAAWTFSVDDHIAMLANAVLQTDLGSLPVSLGMPLEHIQALPLEYVQALRKTLTPPR